MGNGTWTTASAVNYVSTAAKYATYNISSLDDFAKLDTLQIYDAFKLDPALDPKGVKRECKDTEEHPETYPIILALDVTGSMGLATKMCATKLHEIMENLYTKVKDVEFLMMGIGDLSFDRAPIQATQFESDVRILDQTTKIYFERGGGGNAFESYTAAWYFGLHNTDLDCWKRGKKGLIITLGDEPLNPYLPGRELGNVLGASVQDVNTNDLYKAVCEKFNVYHIVITNHESSFAQYRKQIQDSWGELLGQHCIYAKSEDLPTVIGRIVDDCSNDIGFVMNVETGEGISW